jgi:hypothetical protein
VQVKQIKIKQVIQKILWRSRPIIMAEKNSLWKNIREKAKQNKMTGAKPKKPTAAMLKQEAKIKSKNKK